jgi:hypothetical protein
VTEQIATRPRWFQFAFAASLLTFRANGPQIAPLFELPPAGGMIAVFHFTPWREIFTYE